ncbi:MAG: NAD-dependent dehydratase [Kiritimatiellae bacterium]|nr:NAD-dependent dehydratase [Kiritimatiellia bacterium]
MMAKAFAPYFAEDPEVLIYAAGVSNSGETREDAFARERALLATVWRSNLLTVYFGTCSMADPEKRETLYVHHKEHMEEIVQALPRHSILRFPQLVGRTPNPFTLTNYLYRKIVDGESFHVWKNARRHIMDVEDAAAITTHLIRTGQAEGRILNIAPHFSIPIYNLVCLFEQILHKPAKTIFIDKGGAYTVDASVALEAAGQLGISFDNDYTARVLRKYYAPAIVQHDSRTTALPIIQATSSEVFDRR